MKKTPKCFKCGNTISFKKVDGKWIRMNCDGTVRHYCEPTVETSYGGSKGRFRVKVYPDGTTADID